MKLWIDECLSPTLVEQANRRGYWATCNRNRDLLPGDFSRTRTTAWLKYIESPRLRTLASRRLREVLDRAGDEPG